MEWQNRPETNSLLMQFPERYGDEIRGAQGRDVCLSYLRGEIQNIPEQQDLQVEGG